MLQALMTWYRLAERQGLSPLANRRGRARRCGDAKAPELAEVMEQVGVAERGGGPDEVIPRGGQRRLDEVMA